jgi:hypothetical protein
MRGDITARGGKNAAGIGSSDGESEEGVSTCGNITISGGIVDAYGGYYDLTAAAGIGSGNRSRCGDITITTGVTRVSAHSSSTSLFYCIGQGTDGTCGTVTIGGKVGYVKGRDYTYEPGN